MCERDVYAKTADGHDVSKAEKKARKTMQKLGLEQLDDLARQVDAMTMAFEPWRAKARDCLWYSVVLIMAASFSKTIEKRN